MYILYEVHYDYHEFLEGVAVSSNLDQLISKAKDLMLDKYNPNDLMFDKEHKLLDKELTHYWITEIEEI